MKPYAKLKKNLYITWQKLCSSIEYLQKVCVYKKSAFQNLLQRPVEGCLPLEEHFGICIIGF